MRTLVDLEETQVAELDALAGREQQSRAALIRQAIAEFLGRRRKPPNDGFGLWGEKAMDGLEYQRKLREEW